MRKQLAKVYDPREAESRIYAEWQKNGYFHTAVDRTKKPYTIVMPPPNITGQLHMGHAMDNTLQDILIRFRRMQGWCALWVPGTDHAAIATEAKIVAAMAEEGLTKADLGREKYLERAWEWKRLYGGRIVEQLKKLGSSCDWQRERFTMDEGCTKAVREVFVRLYEKGLIYRGERMINWCPHCETSLSDAEVEHREQEGHFWHLRYPLTDGSGYLELATTRPETMLGDTAVAVHPEDGRFRTLIGKTVTLPLVGREIPVVADEYVDPEFGTGVVKITPAHDPNDFEVGKRHKLPLIDVMTEKGFINENGGKYAGLERYEARKAIIKDLQAGGFLIKSEPHTHNVGGCYRCGTVVEPRVSMQWFVKMRPLAEPAIACVEDGRTNFIPDRFKKTYFHWMENIKDWCISRQIWWGHRIPAFYCAGCGETIIAREAPDTCPHCGSSSLTQDPDTLDTWFSSALWPFSTLGWPDKTDELSFFYPTSTLVTGYDIIFFWVARMIFSGIEQMGETPFNTVYIHGLVRDAQGRKMSKSLGNGVDPLEEIEKYGADALRFTLATGGGPGNDIRYSPERVEASRNFANKLWNAARFILMNLPEDMEFPALPENLTLEDKWLLSKFGALAGEVTDNLEKFEIGLATSKLYDFIWDIFCDWYIELAKSRLQNEGDSAQDARAVLVWVLSNTLKLLHPMMPFITEEIWLTLPHDGESVMVSDWPQRGDKLSFAAEEQEFERIIGAIRAVRARRAEMNVPPSKKARVYIETAYEDSFKQAEAFIKRLAGASEVLFELSGLPETAVQIVADGAKIFIPTDELVDMEKERARLKKDIAAAEKQLAEINSKLSNPGFTEKAPAQVVQGQRDAAEQLGEKLALLNQALENLTI